MKMQIKTLLYTRVVIIAIAVPFIIISYDIVHAWNSDSIRAFAGLYGIDCISVIYWPTGEGGDHKMIKRIYNQKMINEFLIELEKIPSKGSGKHAKLDSHAPEYRVEFIKENKLKAFLRIKSDMLDAPFGADWDFYDGDIDKKFVSLVNSLFSHR